MLTQDQRFIEAIRQFCAAEIQSMPKLAECAKDTRPGYALSCMMDQGHEIKQDTRCFQFLGKTLEYFRNIFFKFENFSSNREVGFLGLSAHRAVCRALR